MVETKWLLLAIGMIPFAFLIGYVLGQSTGHQQAAHHATLEQLIERLPQGEKAFVRAVRLIQAQDHERVSRIIRSMSQMDATRLVRIEGVADDLRIASQHIVPVQRPNQRRRQ